MAPSRAPPSPPRDPRLSQSSSKHRVQKRPNPIVPPRPQRSRGNQAVRESGRSNAFASSSNTGDDEDWTSSVASPESDEHTATQVDLSMLGSALDESVRDSHAELQSRVSSGERSPELDRVSLHLQASPPSSPDSIHSIESPTNSPGKRRIAKYRLERLDDLMKGDAELHRTLSDLAGIQQWWKGNKKAWYELREKIRGFDKQISDLQTQADQHHQMVFPDKRSVLSRAYNADWLDERWAPEIEELKEQRELNLVWFKENRKLMKMVWLRVKQIADSVYMEAKANKKLASSYPATRDITDFSWYRRKDRGIKWWIWQAGKDVITLRDKIQVLLDSDQARTEHRGQERHKLQQQLKVVQHSIQAGDTEADVRIADMQQYKASEAEIKRFMVDRRDAKIHDVREEYDLKQMIKDLQLRDQESILTRKVSQTSMNGTAKSANDFMRSTKILLISTPQILEKVAFSTQTSTIS
jgi:hypothetical protein